MVNDLMYVERFKRICIYPPTLLATIQVVRYIRILDILWYCDPGRDHNHPGAPYFWKPWMSPYVAAGAFFFQKNDPIFLEALDGPLRCRMRFFLFRKMVPWFWGWLTNGFGSGYIQFVIPWDIQSIRGRDIGPPSWIVARADQCPKWKCVSWWVAPCQHFG